MSWLLGLGRLFVAAWNWFSSLIESGLRYCVRETNPKHAVATYLTFNSIVTALALFLTKSWPDFFTVVGYWATTTALIVAIIELYRTRMVTAVIREAVLQENSRLRGLHYRHCLERSRSVLASARHNVLVKQWTMAAARLEDLTDYLSYVNSISPAADNRWEEHQRSVQIWIGHFGGGSNGKHYAYNRDEWIRLVLAILEQLDDELAPFQYGEGNADGFE